MLLTSAQVSMFASSGVVFIFTLALFFSGYVIQQRTVSSIQEAIKPRTPAPPPSSSPQEVLIEPLQPSRAFGSALGSAGQRALKLYKSGSPEAKPIDWKKLAHVQLVKDHDEVCSAIMLFAELHAQKSPATKVLMFPKSWAVDGRGEILDPYLMSSKRLMRAAARRYQVVLRPMVTFVDGADDSSRESYSLASLFSLTEYERIMYLEPPGHIFDATVMASVLAFSPQAPLMSLQSRDSPNNRSSEMLLVTPSASQYRQLSKRNAKHPETDIDLLQNSFPYAQDSHILAQADSLPHTSDLRAASEEFNATEFLDGTAYIRVVDSELAGPQYDVPYPERVAARPRVADAEAIWSRVYDGFRLGRMSICGLDLEPLRKD
ncbi:glycosyltransferase family 8 protein [Viridothelium virens]|uniref:Glycosyltransferase family 8 protein n=1 Tax=Viridothelium virens TaxID=1048519 RepID=A0A6A6H6G4_VIRVR|nr:glycosyltransferase family 8 protein [Viridothelium virens]